MSSAEGDAKKGRTIIVTQAEVAAAKLRMKIDAQRGEESSAAIKAVANARPARRTPEPEETE